MAIAGKILTVLWKKKSDEEIRRIGYRESIDYAMYALRNINKRLNKNGGIMNTYSDKFNHIFAENIGGKLVSKEKYRLPRRWDGKDFCKTIYNFFEEYKRDVNAEFPEMEQEIQWITRYLYSSLSICKLS